MYQTIEERINQQIQNMEQLTDKDIMAKFYAFINQRPGIDWRNYGSVNAASGDYKTAAKDKKRALAAHERVLFRNFYNDGLNRRALAESLERAYSGRLSFTAKGELDYTTGQYFPTEYRAAAASVWEMYLRLTNN